MFAIVLSLGINAQNVTKGAVFTAGNQYNAPNNHVYIYAFDTDSLQSWVIDSVLGDFSNLVVADGHFVYAHVGRGTGHPLGGDRIFKYDLLDTTFTAIDSSNAIVGLKKFDIIDDKLVMTRSYPVTSGFVMILDKNDLQSVLYTDSDIDLACDGIAFDNNKAYIASSTVTDSGIVHVIDLGGTISYDGAYPLDSLAVGGQEIYIENGNMYVTHARISPSYSIMYAGVTTVNMNDSSYVTDTTNFVTGTVYTAATGFDFFNGKILADFGNPLETYEVANGTRSQLFSTFPTSAKKDPNAERYIVQTTDYFSFGQVDLYDNQGNVLHTVNTKVSGTSVDMVTNNYPTAMKDTISDFSSSPDPIAVDVLANDFDLDGDEITLDSIIHQPLSGVAVIVNQKIVYTQNAVDWTDPDSIVYVISDAWGDRDTTIVYLDFATSVNEITQFETFIYPNPVKNVLNIRTGNTAIENIQIIDLTGRLVKTVIPVTNQTQVNVAEFNSGIYFVQITINGKVETHRLVIQ